LGFHGFVLLGGGYPHPGCIGKRGCKALKTKEGSSEKRGKRVQEAAKYSRERR
jgi:hypothetical protein